MDQKEASRTTEATPAQLIEELCESFLRTRYRTLSPTIVDVADEGEVALIRELAVPGAQERPLRQTIEEMLRIMSHRVAMEHPRVFGFIPSPVHDTSLLGHIITTMFNIHARSWFESSGPSAVEDVMVKWLAQQTGLPASAGGIFVSGGSMANLTAIVAARDAKLSHEERIRAVVYVSEQTHSSISKGLGVAGFHMTQIRRVECDHLYRLKPSNLRRLIVADRQAGRNRGLWLHVDGTYGASIILSKQYSHLAEDVGRADSLSWDANKWLFQTYGCGVVLVRDSHHLFRSFATNASYIQDADEATSTDVNFWNRGIELTRPVRAMKLWFTLQTLGLDRIGEFIDHGIGLAESAQQAFEKLTHWKIVSPTRLGILNFRYVAWSKSPDGERVEDTSLSERVKVEVSKRAIRQNVAAPLTTRLRGNLNLRMCTISPALGVEELNEIVHALDSLAKEVSAEMEQFE